MHYEVRSGTDHFAAAPTYEAAVALKEKAARQIPWQTWTIVEAEDRPTPRWTVYR